LRKSVKQAGSFLAATLFVCLLSVSTTIPALAHATASPGQPVSSEVQPIANITQAIAYWTPARMKAATPAEKLVSILKVAQNVPASTLSAVNANTSGSSAPFVPQYVTSSGATYQTNTAVTNATQLSHNSYLSYPYSTIGKVFFTDSQTGINYACSGTAVNSNNKNVVDTAGYCVNQGNNSGNWYTNWVFCPQYYNGSAPDGCWGARQLWISYDWYYNNALEDDFGEAVMAPNAHGSLVGTVGGTGWAYGQAANQNFEALSYPAAAPFSGDSIYECPGNGTPYSFEDSEVVSISCNMTGGSSGGPWFISLGGTPGYLNGHVDFRYSNDPNHVYSPYYDYDWYVVFNAAQNS
jgi:hypothetical protein